MLPIARMGGLEMGMQDEVNLREYFRVVWKWKWFVITLVAVSILVTFISSSISKPVYETSVMVRLSEPARLEYPIPDVLKRAVQDEHLIRQVIKDLHLRASPGSIGQNVSTELIANTNLAVIKVSYSNPQKAKLIANGIAKRFVEKSDDIDVKGKLVRERMKNIEKKSKQRLKNLRQQLKDINHQYVETEKKISQISSNPALSNSEKALFLQSTVGRLNSLEGKRLGLLNSIYEIEAADPLFDLQMQSETLKETKIVVPASVPTNTIKSQVKLKVAIAGVLSLILSFGLALFFEYLGLARKG